MPIQARALFSAWERRAWAFFETLDGHCKGPAKSMAAAAKADNSLSSQPNAHNGSTALFRLGASSQGIFFVRILDQEAVKRPAVGARRMPQWSGWILRL
jgi:hypothetical protein